MPDTKLPTRRPDAPDMDTIVARFRAADNLLLRSINQLGSGIEAAPGYDPVDPEIARECRIVFTAGSPDRSDDGVDTAFLSARFALSGGSVQKLIATVSARLAGMLGQKLGAQTLPVLGAVGGATVNYAFMSFYTEMAHVYFGLKRLSEGRDREAVLAEFRAAIAESRPLR